MKKCILALAILAGLALAAKSNVASPIAPTPTCVPAPGAPCPSHDWNQS